MNKKCEGCPLDEPTEEFAVSDYDGGHFYTQHGCERIDDCRSFEDAISEFREAVRELKEAIKIEALRCVGRMRNLFCRW